LNKYTQEDRQEYKITFETGEELYESGGGPVDNTNAFVMHWEAVGAAGDDAFTVNGNKTDDIWLETNTTSVLYYYRNTSNNKITYTTSSALNATSASRFTIEFKDTSVAVTSVGLTGSGTGVEVNWSIDDEGGHGDIEINTELSSDELKYLGETDSDTTVANDVKYNSADISGWKQDTRTAQGFLISSYYDSDSADEFMFSVPGDNVDYDVEVIVSGTSATVSTTGGTTVVNTVAGVSVIKLDSEVTDPASKNLILVGGPAVNSLTAQALGLAYPTTGAASTIPENAATLRLVSNAFGGSNSALVVAGWEADDTRNAASVLQNYASHASALAGNSEVEVRGSTVTAVGGDVTTT
jgi:hypothetical protein